MDVIPELAFDNVAIAKVNACVAAVGDPLQIWFTLAVQHMIAWLRGGVMTSGQFEEVFVNTFPEYVKTARCLIDAFAPLT